MWCTAKQPEHDSRESSGRALLRLACIPRMGPDGAEDLATTLLTLEDVLHPQEGDHIPQNSLHSAETRYVGDVAVDREPRLDRGLVLVDCIVDWGVPGLGNHCPDLSVFEGLIHRPEHPITTFRLKPSGGHCVAALEIVSPADPDTRNNDVKDKVVEYHQARVPLYIIVDQKKKGSPRDLLAYRYTPARYVKVKPDELGRVLIKELGISLGLEDNRLVCFDELTRERLGDYSVERRERLEAQQALQEQTQALQEAERREKEQTQAREAAEKRLRETGGDTATSAGEKRSLKRSNRKTDQKKS